MLQSEQDTSPNNVSDRTDGQPNYCRILTTTVPIKDTLRKYFSGKLSPRAASLMERLSESDDVNSCSTTSPFSTCSPLEDLGAIVRGLGLHNWALD